MQTTTECSLRRPRTVNMVETNLTMEIAQLLLSFLHAWGADVELDKTCEEKLGLLRPLCPISFGLLSSSGWLLLNLFNEYDGIIRCC